MTLKETGYNSICVVTPCNVIKRVFNTVDTYLQDNRDREVYSILPELQRLIFEQSDTLLDSPYKEQAKACAKVLFKFCVRLQRKLDSKQVK